MTAGNSADAPSAVRMSPAPISRTTMPRLRPHRRLTALALTAALLLLGGVTAPAAWAHTDLASSDPADGGTVDGRPGVITLVFADPVGPVDPAAPTVTVTPPGGEPVEVPATVDGDTVTADLGTLPATPDGGAGFWAVAYRLVATDGDTFRGGISFTVTAEAAPSSDIPVSTPVTSEPVEPATSASDTTTQTPPQAPTPTSALAATAGGPTEPSAAAPGPTDAGTTTPAGDTPAPTATAAAAEGGNGWWWFAAVAAIVLLAGGGYWFARSRRA